MHWCKLTLLCIAFLANADGGQVTLTQDKEQVVVGDRVTFTCEVHDMVTGQFLRWQRIVKGLEPINLATNRYLETAFLDDRFTTTGPSDQASNPLIFSFTINKVDFGDSGIFRCNVLGGQSPEFNEKSLTVVRDVTADSLSFKNMMGETPTEVTEGERISFENGEVLSLICTVTKVFPAPKLTIQIGESEVGADVEPTEELFSQITDETKGLVVQWLTVSKTYTGVVRYENMNQRASCTATISGRKPQATKGFVITLPVLPPTLSCDGNVIGREWTTDVRLTCNVTSRPAITDFSVMYYRNHEVVDSNRRFLRLGMLDEYYQLEMNKEKTQVTLIVKQVFMQHFRMYTFIVTNEAGNTSANVTYIKDPDQMDSPTSTSSTISSLVCIQLTVLFAYITNNL